jgi:hypothetical protein
MRSNDHRRRLFGLMLLAGIATLQACVQPRVLEPEAGEAAAAEQISLLTNQVASLHRYASQMEEIYAAQEAEILSLRKQVASLSPRQPE